jgi:diacylglycerol kinase (CTP)
MAPRKSLAGFIAGSLTGALVAASFWGRFAPRMAGPDAQLSWTWEHGVSDVPGTGGWLGLSVLAAVTGLITGVAEALGTP